MHHRTPRVLVCCLYNPFSYLADLDATCQLVGWTGCRVNEHERDDIRVPRELHTLLKRQQLWSMPRSRVRALVFSFLLDILL